MKTVERVSGGVSKQALTSPEEDASAVQFFRSGRGGCLTPVDAIQVRSEGGVGESQCLHKGGGHGSHGVCYTTGEA